MKKLIAIIFMISIVSSSFAFETASERFAREDAERAVQEYLIGQWIGHILTGLFIGFIIGMIINAINKNTNQITNAINNAKEHCIMPPPLPSTDPIIQEYITWKNNQK